MIDVTFIDIDSMNRPVFMDINKNFYGCLNTLFSYHTSASKVMKRVTASDLVYFGTHFDCEPIGTTPASELRIIG